MAENRGICSDAEGQCGDGDGGEAGVFAKLSKAVAGIRNDRGDPITNPCFANLFFHLFDAAKFDPRSPFCFLRRHPRTNVFLDQHFKMRMNLLVEVRLHTTRGEEISQKTSSFYKEWHAENLSTTFRVPDRWPTKCGPIA